MFSDTQIADIIDLLIEFPDSKVYLGCDSVRFQKNKKRFARYATILVIHKDGSKGCRIFDHKSVEPDYDMKKNRPRLRMMNEVMKVCELYNQLAPILSGYDVEIHLDISTDPKNGSNCAASEAAGYVLGVTGVEPKLKPESFAASFGADSVVNGKTHPEKEKTG